MSEARTANSSIPLWMKVAWTAWLVVWAPVYWRQYGAQNFLYFCDLGNFLIAVGLWRESRLILSWQAVGLLIFQTLYALDLIGAVLFGHHIVGGTEYMFDPKVPLFVRLLGLYHLVVPPLLLWSVRRLGYDERAWKLQTLTAWVLVPINFFWRREYNVNWARGLGHEQHLVPHWMYLAAYLILVPLVVYWPTHLALKRCTAKTRI
ncbi:MAG: hypothetical protein JWN74_2036 [Acidobacteriaceae bacterium]|nr:hypothetical protein [Acidobacteriaceae bacterium]